jgi:hypothetical protein
VEHATGEDAHLGRVLSTAKLVTTFSAAFAATFVATALQVGQPTWLDYVPACTMLMAGLGDRVRIVRQRRGDECGCARRRLYARGGLVPESRPATTVAGRAHLHDQFVAGLGCITTRSRSVCGIRRYVEKTPDALRMVANLYATLAYL